MPTISYPICPKCGKKLDDLCLTVYPAKHVRRCYACGYTEDVIDEKVAAADIRAGCPLCFAKKCSIAEEYLCSEMDEKTCAIIKKAYEQGKRIGQMLLMTEYIFKYGSEFNPSYEEKEKE